MTYKHCVLAAFYVILCNVFMVVNYHSW